MFPSHTPRLHAHGALFFCPYRFNKYSQICARALRQSLKETERVTAEKRGTTILRYQEWKNGQGAQQVCAQLDPACPRPL